jgi:hypothetical protein
MPVFATPYAEKFTRGLVAPPPEKQTILARRGLAMKWSASARMMEAGAGDEPVDDAPSGGDFLGGARDLRPVGDIAARGAEGPGMFCRKIGLIGAGEAPHVVAAREKPLDERAADARAGSGDDDFHGRLRKRNLATLVKQHAAAE